MNGKINVALFAVLIIVVVVFLVGNQAQAPTDNEIMVPNEEEMLWRTGGEVVNSVTVANPLPGSEITSPLVVTGEAPGNWFFEGDAPVLLTNWDGEIIAESYITAQGDWMTTDLVPFSGTLEFTIPEYGDIGTLILQRDNPSDLPENDAAVEMRVLFSR